MDNERHALEAKRVGRRKVRICGRNCTPGDTHCNGYCRGEADSPNYYIDDTVLLEDLLRMTVPAKDKDGNDIQITPEFRVAIQDKNENGVHIIIHANGHDSETLDYLVKNNTLTRL